MAATSHHQPSPADRPARCPLDRLPTARGAGCATRQAGRSTRFAPARWCATQQAGCSARRTECSSRWTECAARWAEGSTRAAGLLGDGPGQSLAAAGARFRPAINGRLGRCGAGRLTTACWWRWCATRLAGCSARCAGCSARCVGCLVRCAGGSTHPAGCQAVGRFSSVTALVAWGSAGWIFAGPALWGHHLAHRVRRAVSGSGCSAEPV